MDHAFNRPITVSAGRTALTITTVQQAGAYLIGDWPAGRRGRKSYRMAVRAVCQAITGRLEPEAARQALILAIEDLAGTKKGPLRQVMVGLAEAAEGAHPNRMRPDRSGRRRGGRSHISHIREPSSGAG
jgi:Protein of unknown function (DUF982)